MTFQVVVKNVDYNCSRYVLEDCLLSEGSKPLKFALCRKDHGEQVHAVVFVHFGTHQEAFDFAHFVQELPEETLRHKGLLGGHSTSLDVKVERLHQKKVIWLLFMFGFQSMK